MPRQEDQHESTPFAQRYRMIEPLGEGAMGVVWLAFDEQERRRCALKQLKPHLHEAAHLERFKREFRAIARLAHPHCIRCYEQGVHQEQAYFTMEYVPGGSLELQRWDRPEAVVDLGRQLLAGLDHIHARGIVHRDLKPQNIFLEIDAGRTHARLGDFGIVKIADFRDEGVGLGDVLGSLRFLAPESIEHGTADPRSDLYSLGIILYYLLAGEHPCGPGHHSARQWLVLHRDDHRVPLYRSDVPAELAAVIMRLCHRRPEARFASAAAAYDALEAVVPLLGDYGWSRPPPLLRRPHLAAPNFVGRRSQLRAAREFLTRGLAGTPGPCILFIEGAAGLGKSRLMRELLADSVQADVQVFTGTCPAEGSAAYAPIRELLDELEIATTSTAPSVGHTLDDSGARARGGASPSEPTVDLPDLPGPQAHGDLSIPHFVRRAELSPQQQAMLRLRLHERLARRLREQCRHRPILLIIDDAQWADIATLQFIGHVARVVSLARSSARVWPVGIVLTHRPVPPNSPLGELRETTAASGAREEIVLGPLADTDAVALVASMLMQEPADIPAAFATPLLAQAEGSPLFLSQVVQLLVGEGQLVPDGQGLWRVGEQGVAVASLPASVSLAIGERAARLAVGSKQLLAAAAVVGRVFEVSLVARMLEEDEVEQLDRLDELIRAEFVEDHRDGYRFVHDRIRESIYDTLEPANRTRLHRAAALALCEQIGDAKKVWPLIAHHFEHAGEYGRAHRYAMWAAGYAYEEHAHGMAESMYRLALRCAEHDASLELDSKLWERYGDTCAALGHYAEAIEGYERRLADELGPVERRVILSKIGTLENKRGRFHEAVAAIEQMLGLTGFAPPRSELAVRGRIVAQLLRALLPARRWSGSLEDGDARARSFALATECWYCAGDHGRSVYYSLLAANTARQVGASPGSVRALAGFAYALTLYGFPGPGAILMKRTRSLARSLRLDDSDGCLMEAMAGLCYALEGRVSDALAQLDVASERYGNSDNAEARMLSYITHALVGIAAGHDYPRMGRIGRQLRHFAEETNDARAMGWAGEIHGHIALRRERSDEGLAALHGASEHCLSVNDLTFASSINDALALFLALEGELAEALERGQFAARTVLRGRLRHYFPIDGGLLVAAALARRSGHSLPSGVEILIRPLLRRQRFVARASRLTTLRFEVGVAAWRAAHGKPADFDAVIQRAQDVGLAGEAWVAHRVAAAFEPEWRARHQDAMRRLREGFERA